MLDGVSLDQLRTFLAAVDEGSFSAAGRRLGRAQSVISQSLANLEAQLAVRLFDRGGRRPVLTDQGRALLPEARRTVGSMDRFKALAKGLSSGLEPELSVVVDVMFPIDVLTAAVGAFQEEFPDTPLRLYVEALGAVVKPVLEGRCAFGIIGSLPTAPPNFTAEWLRSVDMMMVAAPSHPLASYPGALPSPVLADHVQLVLTDRSELSQGREFGVLSAKTWRLADLGAKHAFLRAGLGWGSMPRHMIEADLLQGALVPLTLEDFQPRRYVMTMSAIYQASAPPGPAGRWLVGRLKADQEQSASMTQVPVTGSTRAQ
jgi:DNA-binding transcriptional LysR family regulator